MDTRKIFAAAASLAIVASTVTLFQVSSQATFKTAAITSSASDGRPVVELATFNVYATPLPQVAADSLTAHDARGTSELGLPAVENASLRVSSPLYMPYYSFATNLRSMIKE